MNNIITIVTPSYNQGQFIEETIDSVLSQEGDFFIQYIIADGRSTDNSIEIIKKYERLIKEKKYPVKCKSIEYIWWSKKDRGQSQAINQGFKIAKGDVLAWICSDDYYEPGAFDFVLKKFKKNPEIDLIHGDCYAIKKDTNRRIPMRSRQIDFELLLKNKVSVYQPSAFFTKKIFKKVDFLDENLHYTMDYDLWIRMLEKGKSLYCPKILSNARIWKGSKTSPYQEKIILRKKGKKEISQTKYYSGSAFEGNTKDFEYLLEKHKKWLNKYPSAYATRLRHLGTMNLILGKPRKSKEYFLQCIKVKPNIRNISTFLLSLLGRKFYWYLLSIKRKIVGGGIYR